MIYHVSLPAKDPTTAAETLARILDGEAMPFPPVPGAWIAWSGDGVTEIEVFQRGGGVRRAEGRAPDWSRADPDPGAFGWHVAIGTTRPARDVLHIAAEAGWPAQISDRGGFFEVVEVWVDDACLVEVLDPEMQGRYRGTFTRRTWKEALRATPS